MTITTNGICAAIIECMDKAQALERTAMTAATRLPASNSADDLILAIDLLNRSVNLVADIAEVIRLSATT